MLVWFIMFIVVTIVNCLLRYTARTHTLHQGMNKCFSFSSTLLVENLVVAADKIIHCYFSKQNMNKIDNRYIEFQQVIFRNSSKTQHNISWNLFC